ncbi:MAG: hypothetical protein L6R38_008425 [Xanthoria sp. 2 TBL-2021]|nr:MAG: hypothetical protein L6R38_008425 [Xanthoria sp. 2 TBL-2021]
MDPITAIGLLASLSNLIQASNSLLKVLKSFKDGDKELLELFNDVSVFAEALKGFDRVLRSRQTNHKISTTVISNALEEASKTIQELESKLTHVSSSGSSTMRRVKWVQHKTSINKLHGHVKDQSTMLQSFLALAHAETFLDTCRQYPQFLQIRSLSANDINSDAVSTSSETTTIMSETSASSRRRASVDTIASSVASSDSPLQKTSSNPSDKPPQGLRVEDPLAASVILRKACRYDCYCKCHTQDVATKRGFSRAVDPCTDRSCHAFKQTTVAASSFFRKALAQVASSRCIKVRYDINTFRMVSEGSDAMRYVKHGNLDKLKMCVQAGEATLWDTAPDGWSLLHVSMQTVVLSKPADLAILKSLANDATDVEREIVEIFSKKDDYVRDFDFTPIHTAVLNLYDVDDRERPNLEQLIEVVDDCNNAPAGTDWAQWKLRYRKRSNLFNDIIELFRSAAFEKPKTEKIIHNLLDQKDKKYHWTPLHWASSAGHLDKMRVLVRHGADPFILSNLDANILHAAAESKSTSGLDGALEIWRRYPQRLDINQANRWAETPLHVAAWGSLNAVQKLLEAGADRNVRQEDGQVPLHCTGLSEHGRVRRKIVALLCGETGPHVNAQDVDGRPPIFDFLDDPICIQTLVEHGARLDLLDSAGRSAFHHACIQDDREALKTLLNILPSWPAIVTVKDHDGNTALIQALLHGSIVCAMMLLKLDDIGDIVGQGGWTAAHHAAKRSDPTVLEAVMRHPSFVKGSKTIDGKTVEVVAMEAGNWCGEIRRLLREYNAIM